MNNYYNIEKVNNNKFNYIVYANSYVDPFESSKEILDEIELNNGIVLFDLLLKNGNSHNRFVSIRIDNKNFRYDTIKIEKEISSDIKELCKVYYSSHIDYVENSIIPKALKFLIKKGRII